MACRVITAVILLVSLCFGVNAYPTLWRDKQGSCSAHPTSKQHLHGAPVEDTATTFVVRDGKGSAVRSLCPGQTYTVSVAFPEARLSLTTANVGTLVAATGADVDNACPNRVVAQQTSIAAVNTLTWDVPCFPSSTSGILKVTSAAGERYPFQSSGLTIPIDSNCAAAACSKAASTTTVAKAADANVNGAGGTAAGAAALALAGLAAMVL